jgi:hypothetical protein
VKFFPSRNKVMVTFPDRKRFVCPLRITARQFWEALLVVQASACLFFFQVGEG